MLRSFHVVMMMISLVVGPIIKNFLAGGTAPLLTPLPAGTAELKISTSEYLRYMYASKCDISTLNHQNFLGYTGTRWCCVTVKYVASSLYIDHDLLKYNANATNLKCQHEGIFVHFTDRTAKQYDRLLDKIYAFTYFAIDQIQLLLIFIVS